MGLPDAGVGEGDGVGVAVGAGVGVGVAVGTGVAVAVGAGVGVAVGAGGILCLGSSTRSVPSSEGASEAFSGALPPQAVQSTANSKFKIRNAKFKSARNRGEMRDRGHFEFFILNFELSLALRAKDYSHSIVAGGLLEMS